MTLSFKNDVARTNYYRANDAIRSVVEKIAKRMYVEVTDGQSFDPIHKGTAHKEGRAVDISLRSDPRVYAELKREIGGAGWVDIHGGTGQHIHAQVGGGPINCPACNLAKTQFASSKNITNTGRAVSAGSGRLMALAADEGSGPAQAMWKGAGGPGQHVRAGGERRPRGEKSARTKNLKKENQHERKSVAHRAYERGQHGYHSKWASHHRPSGAHYTRRRDHGGDRHYASQKWRRRNYDGGGQIASYSRSPYYTYPY